MEWSRAWKLFLLLAIDAKAAGKATGILPYHLLSHLWLYFCSNGPSEMFPEGGAIDFTFCTRDQLIGPGLWHMYTFTNKNDLTLQHKHSVNNKQPRKLCFSSNNNVWIIVCDWLDLIFRLKKTMSTSHSSKHLSLKSGLTGLTFLPLLWLSAPLHLQHCSHCFWGVSVMCLAYVLV